MYSSGLITERVRYLSHVTPCEEHGYSFTQEKRNIKRLELSFTLMHLSITLMCAQLCPTLCEPMDCSPPSSSVHGIFHARILEWVAIPYPRGSSQPGDQTCISRLLHWQEGSLPLAPPGKRSLSVTHYYYY